MMLAGIRSNGVLVLARPFSVDRTGISTGGSPYSRGAIGASYVMVVGAMCPALAPRWTAKR
jgi:hypothetical protein